MAKSLEGPGMRKVQSNRNPGTLSGPFIVHLHHLSVSTDGRPCREPHGTKGLDQIHWVTSILHPMKRILIGPAWVRCCVNYIIGPSSLLPFQRIIHLKSLHGLLVDGWQ